LKSINKILEWINNHWGALAILGGMFWSFVTAIWVAFALPLIDAHIDSRIMVLADDSLSVMVDSHLKTKGGGFRGGFSDVIGLEKDEVVDFLFYMYLEERELKNRLDILEFSANYQNGFNKLMIKLVCTKSEYNQVPYWLANTGDAFYEDGYGLIWDANYNYTDDCYYYYPPYNGNKRTKCIKLINY